MHLQQRVGADLLYREGGCRREEPSVLDFFDSFADRENERAVDEGEDDVRVVRVLKKA